jgi:DNA gyrase subunit A
MAGENDAPMADAPQPESIQELQIIDEMQDSYLTYAMSVIMARALPDVRDGLKPSQRRILVAMNDLNLGPRSQHRKCAKISGDTSGNYHPHGDSVIYPTLVRLAQPFNMRYTLVDGQGNFGSIDGDPPAAMRYTEARMSQAAVDMLEDIQYETVDYEDNFDSTRQEPVVLPAKFPNLLVNGSTGIAVGMATNIPPHNIGEICDAIVKVVDDPHASTDQLMQIVKGPDFPTGAMICGNRGIHEAHRTGRGTVTVRAKMHVEEHRNRELIVINEIPYQILKGTITERIADCVKKGQLPEVADVRDESDRKHPVRIVVELKRDQLPDLVMNKLYQYTPLQSNFTIMNVAVVNRRPRTLNLKQLIEAYVDHRRDVIRRRTQFLLRKARQRAHIVEGLILAVGDIDEIIALIKQSPDPPTAKERLMARPLRLRVLETIQVALPEAFVARTTNEDQFLTGVQAQAILAMQLQRLTGLEIEKLTREYVGLIEEIEGYEAILRDQALVNDIIREDAYEMRDKYGDARRTEIGPAVEGFTMEELIADEQVIVTVSHEGYIKRVPVDAYRKQGRGGKGLKGSDTRDGDFIEKIFSASTHDYLLIFTTRGRVYWLKVYDVPQMQRTSRGRSIANLVHMQSNESYRAMTPVKQFQEKFVLFATAKGTIKKTALGAFSRPRPSGIIAIGLDPDDELISVDITSGEDQVMLCTRDGWACRFHEKDVRAMGRSAHGVRGMALRGDDAVVDMIVVRAGVSALTVCEYGYGKRTDIEEYRLTRRGGKGVINIKATERNGKVVAVKAVTDDDELMLITAKGILLRTDLSQIREIGRATQGVRLIRPAEDDKVVAVARIQNEEDEGEEADEAEPEGTDGAGAADNAPVEPTDQAEPPDDADTSEEGPVGPDPDEDETGEEEDENNGDDQDEDEGSA